MQTYPDELELTPLSAPPNLRVRVPGSKSITNRAFVLAALTEPGMNLSGTLQSEDTEVMIDCLQRLGWEIACNWERNLVSVRWPANRAVFQPAELFVQNSGTTIRLLTAMLALGHGTYRLDGIPRMRERPIEDLLDGLRQLGVDARSEANNHCPPVILNANGLRGGHVRVRADVSSQYLSGLMLAAPFAQNETTIELAGTLVSEPYIDMTIAMLRDFGLTIQNDTPGIYRIPGQQRSTRYVNGTYAIEPDASSASYFLGAAAVSGGTIIVEGLNEQSLQGDVRLLNLLEEMGCEAIREPNALGLKGGTLRGIDADMNEISDTMMTLAAVACFAEGPTRIRNVAHVRHKETDRIAAMAMELRKLGAKVQEFDDGLEIVPQPLRGCSVATYNDHRMAMSLAIVGLRVPGVKIQKPGCVMKTYPGFWEDWKKLG